MNKFRKKRRKCEDCINLEYHSFLFFSWRSCKKKLIFKEPKDGKCNKFFSWRRLENEACARLKKNYHILGKTW